ncbi:hypothetical protein N7493_011862 [Penicillium malachiteum]|uniref:Uncharacterized protein n=1 Tax=Penicillium malachiteum TaxID=1324776 RepID=A0AAD6HAL7_9EURO|nr:hypothetical protein N7493_011862 [Penicillium malachiteum]
MLIACYLPVIAGYGYHLATPIAGYALTGFFGPVVSLIITIGASNVAGATKKTIMAATTFVAYTNRLRDEIELDEVLRDKIAFDDLTDKQNPFFRYVL